VGVYTGLGHTQRACLLPWCPAAPARRQLISRYVRLPVPVPSRCPISDSDNGSLTRQQKVAPALALNKNLNYYVTSLGRPAQARPVPARRHAPARRSARSDSLGLAGPGLRDGGHERPPRDSVPAGCRPRARPCVRADRHRLPSLLPTDLDRVGLYAAAKARRAGGKVEDAPALARPGAERRFQVPAPAAAGGPNLNPPTLSQTALATLTRRRRCIWHMLRTAMTLSESAQSR
jgi:hypothetical protein